MQTQPSVMDIGSSTVASRGSAAKSGGDDGQFADTLRDQLHSGGAREASSQTPHGRDAASGEVSAPAQESSEGTAKTAENRDTSTSPENRRQGEEAEPEAAESADSGNLLPLLTLLPPQPLAPEVTSAVPGESSQALLPFAALQGLRLVRGNSSPETQPLDGLELPEVGAEMMAGDGAQPTSARQSTQALSQTAATAAEEQGDGAADFKALLTTQWGQSRDEPAVEIPPLVEHELGSSIAPQPAANTVTTPPMAALPAAAPVQPSTAPLLTVAAPLAHPQWGGEVGERVVWMVKQELQEAQIQLNPRNLGPIEVRISMQNDQANVQFVAQHHATREALEAALPRLRELFQEAGLQMGQSAVHSQQSFQQQQQSNFAQGEMGRRDGRAGVEESLADNPTLVVESPLSPRGIDYYA